MVLSKQLPMAEGYLDHKPFLSDNFNVHDYANATIAGRTYDPDGLKGDAVQGERDDSDTIGDTGAALARLNQGIEDATRQLRQEITQNHPILLAHLTQSTSLSSSLAVVRTSLTDLQTSIARLHSKVHTPHSQLALLVRRLALLSDASDLARRAARFVLLARRLEGQMREVERGQGDKVTGEGEREREMAKAALSIAELDALLNPPAPPQGGKESPLPLQSLSFVVAHEPSVVKARETIVQEMESMVVNGLQVLNQPLLSTSLQTAYNLRLLPQLVESLLTDLNEAVDERIKRALDSTAIGREVASRESTSAASQAASVMYRSRNKVAEPTNANITQWISVLWSRLEHLIDEIANCCIKVYTLEKVLRMKKDPTTQTEFLDAAMKVLDEKPSFLFWTNLAQSFEKQTRDAARSSAWLQQALSSGYPRLLRLFQDFFGKIAVHTDTVYTRDHQSPETVLVLRSVANFETLYLSRSTTRMNEAVQNALAAYQAGRGNPPGPAEGVAIARTVTNELDSARFDPLLVRSVARNASRVLEGMTARIEAMFVRDFTATSLVGPNATPAQTVNGSLTSCLYHCWLNLNNISDNFAGKVFDTILPSIDTIESAFLRVTDALNIALRRELSSVLARIHKVDFSKAMDPMSMSGGGSPYIQEIVKLLNYIRLEVLAKFSLGEMGREWVLSLVRHVIHGFLLNASIVRPLSESGKLKLTSDMTELEFALGTFLTTGAVQGAKNTIRLENVGEEYLALRAFRTMLFLDLASLVNPAETDHSPPLIVLHHIIVLSPLRLPHELHGWTEPEYLLWLDKHDDEEHWTLVEKAVEEQLAPGEGDGEYIKLVREVLDRARHEPETP